MKKFKKAILLAAIFALLLTVTGCKITVEPINNDGKESSKTSILEDIKDAVTPDKPIDEESFLNTMKQYGNEVMDEGGYYMMYTLSEVIKIDQIRSYNGVRKDSEDRAFFQCFTWCEFRDEEAAKAYFEEQSEELYETLESHGGDWGKVDLKNSHESYWVEFTDIVVDGTRFVNQERIARIGNTIVYCFTSRYTKGDEYDNIDEIFRALGYSWPDEEYSSK